MRLPKLATSFGQCFLMVMQPIRGLFRLSYVARAMSKDGDLMALMY